MLKSGFALVLYSRLYLVMPPTRRFLRRVVLISVLVTATLIHVPEAAAAIMLYVAPSPTSIRFYDITGYLAMSAVPCDIRRIR